MGTQPRTNHFPLVVLGVILLVSLVAIVMIMTAGSLRGASLGASRNLGGEAACSGPPVFVPDYNTLIAHVGNAFSYTVQVSGQDTLTVDTLPAGLSLSGTTIVGTPSATQGGSRITFTATNACGTRTQGYAIVVNAQYTNPSWCFLSSTQAVSGQPGTLTWQVPSGLYDHPTSATFSPALPSFPDGTHDGTAPTAPLTQDTTFTLTISNPGGSYSCKTTATVFSNAPPTTSGASSPGLNPPSCASCTADQACINGACVALPPCTSLSGQFCQSDDDGTPLLADRTLPGMGTCGAGQYCMRCRGSNVFQNGQCVPPPSCVPCTAKVLGAYPAAGAQPGISNWCAGSDLHICGFDNCEIAPTHCANGCQTFSDGGSACR